LSVRSKQLAVIGAVVVVVLVGVGAFLASRSSTGSSSTASEQVTTSTSSGPAGTDPTATGSTESTDTTVDPNKPDIVPPTTQPAVIPLNIQASSTSGLTDGQAVTFHITPTPGANVYGAEAFLCAPDTNYTLDADIRPSLSGKCVTKRLSPNSLDYLNKAVGPPYQALDLSFPVGVGSDSFTTQDGRSITITCGPGHPCTLVLKLQFSHGFGFKAYPLTYR